MLLLIAIVSRVLLVLTINSVLDNFADNFCLCYESYGKKLLSISIVIDFILLVVVYILHV